MECTICRGDTLELPKGLPKTCKLCGEKGLHWHRKRQGFRLYYADGREHSREVGTCGGSGSSGDGERYEGDGASSAEVKELRGLVTELSARQDALAPKIDAIATAIDTRVNAMQATLDKLSERREVEIVYPDGKRKEMGRQHRDFDKLVKLMDLSRHVQGMNVRMVGPAGGGKTTAAGKAAEALDLPFYPFPVGPQTSEAKLMGYMDANGKYVATALRKAYEHGGVILFDEMDAANAAVLTIINGLLANGEAGFPDQTVKRHPDFIAVAGMNTFGNGADAMYVGRAQLDAATLSRWKPVLNWDYDWAFIEELSGNAKWTAHVRKLYEAAASLKMRVIIDPRCALVGAGMLAGGIEWSEVEETTVWAGISKDDRTKIVEVAK